MNTVFKNLFFIGLAPLLLWSCKKEENKVYLKNGVQQTLTLSSGSVTMAKVNGSKIALKAAWSAAEFGYPAGISYTVQFDKTGGTFSSPYEVSMGTGRAKEFTQLELNTAFLSVGNIADQPGSIIMRVKSVISGTSVAAVYSNVAALTGTPYSLEPPSLYLPGAYQGWDPASATRIWAYTQTEPKKFDGFVVFDDPTKLEFKITTKPDWTVNYGDGGSGKLEADGPNFSVATTGMYRMQVDLTTDPGTFTITNFGSGWSLIGSAGIDWNTDIDLTYDQATKIWSKTIALSDNEFKFRANHDWTLNFGDGGSTTIAGGKTLSYNGPNLKVPSGAGTYKIELILSDNENFSYKLTKQ